MFELAHDLAAAKSRQDVPAALRLLHPEMLLESPAFGTRACGPAENELALTRFFASFPDYDVALHGHASNGDTLVCWGTARMTMTGDRFGVMPNGRRAELPVFIQFTFKDDLIASERFFFDLSRVVRAIGYLDRRGPAEAVRSRLMTPDPRVKAIGEITTRHLFDMVVDLNPRLEFGAGPLGRRTLFGSAGGTFHGPRLRGEVLPGGGDWALFRPDGAMTLDVRLTLRTHDGALVHMTYSGRWVFPPDLRADLANPAKQTPHRPGPLLLPDQPSLRDRRGAIRMAERHRLRGIGVPGRRRHRL